ncbi:MAG: PQQ-binding-like beta-propeller repeat protein [Planctomycetaceae bacterium]
MKMRVLVLALLAATASEGLADDWVHWRGPEQNGISRDTGLPDTWSLETGENVIWSDGIGGRATPVIMNGKVYITCRTTAPLVGADKVNLQEQLVCRDLETGKVLWKDVFNVFQTDIPAPRVGWAAMAADPETKQVYMHSVSGLFRCYTETGELVWEHSLFEDFGKISGYGGRTQAPIIDEDRVIVGFFMLNWGKTGNPPPKQTYFVFDKKSGELLWTTAPGQRPKDTNYSVPFVTVIDGVRQLIGGNADGGIYGVNARTGESLWGMRMSKRGLNTTAVADGNLVYIAHGEDNIDNTEFGRIQCVDASKRGDFTESGGAWRIDGVKVGYTALLVKDGVLYAVADTGKLYAYDSKTGEALWDYSLGTVGKGSPIWADGKLYAMEVNGNIHILKADRTGCKSLSKVSLKVSEAAAERGFKGMDEIYASPVVSNGRVVFVTRDRTICIGMKDGWKASPPVKMAEEKPATDKIAHLKLTPFETTLSDGGEVEYKLHAFDANGHLIKSMPAEGLSVADGLADAKADGAKVVVPAGAKEQSGEITAKVGDMTATARLRVFPPAPWKWDFAGYKGLQVPPTWINATKKLFPTDMDGEVVMRKKSTKTGGRGRPSAYIWLGPSTMKDYTVQADVMLTEARRQIPAVGVTANRYNFILDGNKWQARIQSWAPHKRMAVVKKYKSKPDTWYTIKVSVDVVDGKAHVKGKVWERGKDEPAEWTVEAHDPHPNENGSPGLYFFSLADSYVDNVSVTPNK